jgi:hypothetical protein
LVVPATDLFDIDDRTRHPVLGLALGMATLLVCAVAFFVSLAGCRAENQTHYPAACPLADHHPGTLVFVAVVLSLAIFVVGLTHVPRRVLTALAGLGALLYVGYAFSVAVT